MDGLCDEWKSLLDMSLVPVIDDSERIVPEKENIWRAFNLCKPCDLKVCIIGQDPYHTINKDGTCMADGMAFSYNGKVKASLKNIFKEIESDVGIVNQNTVLDNWASQGVLLLNTALTTYAKKAGAHVKEWRPFINSVIEVIRDLGCIFVLWGNHAKTLKSLMYENSVVLEAGHPSPLNNSKVKFIGCRHFSQINEILRNSGREGILWST